MIDKISNTIVNDKVKSVYSFNDYSIQDLLSKFFEQINNVTDLVNQNEEKINIQNFKLEEFINYMKSEGIPPLVIETVTTMYNDGRLTELFNNLANNVIDKVNSSLEQSANSNKVLFNNKKSGYGFNNKGIVVFIDDDTRNGSKLMVDLFKKYNKRFTLACPINVNGDDYMDIEYLKTIQDEGFEIASHGYSHINISELTLEEQKKEFENSLFVSSKNGLRISNLIYPYNAYNEDTKKIVLDYFKSGVALGNASNKIPINQRHLNRVALGSFQINNIANCKVFVDRAKQNKELLIFMTHAYAESSIESEGNLYSIEEVLKYCISIGIDVMTLDESLKYFGNLIDVENKETFLKLAPNGKIYTEKGGSEYFKEIDYLTGEETIQSIITKYGVGIFNTLIPTNVANLGFVPAPGYLISELPANSAYARQYLKKYNSSDTYTRRGQTDGSWTAWEKLSNLGTVHSFGTTVANVQPKDYPKEQFLCSVVPTSLATGMPENKAGLLTTYTFSDFKYWKQEYTLYNSNEIYYRKGIDETTWGAWQKITTTSI